MNLEFGREEGEAVVGVNDAIDDVIDDALGEGEGAAEGNEGTSFGLLAEEEEAEVAAAEEGFWLPW